MIAFLQSLRAQFDRLPGIWKYSMLMLVLSKIGDLSNFYVSMFLVMDSVTQKDLGAILPLQNLTGLAAVPLTVTTIVGIKFIHLFESQGAHGKTRRLLRDITIFNTFLTLLMLGYTFKGFRFVADRMNIEGHAILWALLGLATTNAWMPLMQNFAKGLKQWKTLILTTNVLGPTVRVLGMALLLGSFGVAGYLSAQMIRNLTVIGIFAWGTFRHLRRHTAPMVSYRDHLPEMRAFLFPILLLTTINCLQNTVEPWVLRQRLNEMDSGAYYYLNTLGNIPRYLSGAILPFIFIFVADKHERGQSTTRLHLQTMAVTLIGGIGASLLLAWIKDPLTAFRPTWAQYAAYTPYLFTVCVTQALQSTITIHLAHENASRRFGYLLYYLPVLFVEIGILYGLNLWHLARPYLPATLWHWVHQNLAFSFGGTITFLLLQRILLSLLITIQLWRRYRPNRPPVR